MGNIASTRKVVFRKHLKPMTSVDTEKGRQTMSDLIERDKIMNILEDMDVGIIPYAHARKYVQITIYHIRKELGDMPSADAVSREDYEVMQFCFEQMKSLADKLVHNARPKEGKWIDRGMRVPSSWVKKCSLCGHETDTWRWCKFCPNCGADMRGKDDE